MALEKHSHKRMGEKNYTNKNNNNKNNNTNNYNFAGLLTELLIYHVRNFLF